MNEQKEFIGSVIWLIGFILGIITSIVFMDELMLVVAKAASWLLNLSGHM